ncbi:MAG: hypothetical protein MUF16_06430 [Burkholderiaceae bacterium]|jgi:hypothetical protein|nr:hypothetical protein [Burkholderiaceae bacterium]
MNRSWRAAGTGLLLALAAAAQAAEPDAAVAERKQIRTERAAAEARYKQAEADCNQRFAVSGCIAEAQAQRRETMSGLRTREIALDEAQRKAEAQESARRIEAKRTEAANKPPPVPRAASAPSAASASSAASRAGSERTRQRSKTADDATAAAARVAAQQLRASEAAAHRQEVEQRNAERSARGKKSNPLPVPTAASVAAAGSAAAK